MLIAAFCVVVGSTTGAATPNFTVLLVVRALQGAWLGLSPLGISPTRDVLPAERVGNGVGLVSSSLGIGAPSGYRSRGRSLRAAAGGDSARATQSSRSFLVLVLESPIQAPGRFDWVGAGGLAIGPVCFLITLIEGRRM
ncbi:hypothetical protein [Pseudonocardia xishanensis]|uniref:MFS transporter n=1 Tax=Pseudonocardia xishanensis TaxID=630995 RepID=A0ABP8RZC4_9PSEU